MSKCEAKDHIDVPCTDTGAAASGVDGDGAQQQQQSSVERALAKVGRRVLPLCFAVALMNHLDRSK